VLPSSPLRYAGTAPRPLTPEPAIGEHTDAVLADWLGMDDAAIGGLRGAGVIG